MPETGDVNGEGGKHPATKLSKQRKLQSPISNLYLARSVTYAALRETDFVER